MDSSSPCFDPPSLETFPSVPSFVPRVPSKHLHVRHLRNEERFHRRKRFVSSLRSSSNFHERFERWKESWIEAHDAISFNFDGLCLRTRWLCRDGRMGHVQKVERFALECTKNVALVKNTNLRNEEGSCRQTYPSMRCTKKTKLCLRQVLSSLQFMERSLIHGISNVWFFRIGFCVGNVALRHEEETRTRSILHRIQ